MKAEQFIQDHIRNCSNIEYKQGVYAPTYQPWLTPGQALKAVEMEREEVIEKVCAFLKDRIEHDSIDYPMATMHLIDDLERYVKGIEL